MNAAARILTENLAIASAPAQVRRITLSKQAVLFLSLMMAVIISALMMITTADNNRIAIGDLASLKKNRDDLLTTYGQLLLEENTWGSAGRVETIAEQNFGMQQPDPKQVIMIHP